MSPGPMARRACVPPGFHPACSHERTRDSCRKCPSVRRQDHHRARRGVDDVGVLGEDELAPAQEQFVEQRKEGFYTPLVNTINMQQQEMDEDQQEFDNDLALEQKKMAKEQQKPRAGTGSTLSLFGMW